jgi:hypothetical protein
MLDGESAEISDLQGLREPVRVARLGLRSRREKAEIAQFAKR